MGFIGSTYNGRRDTKFLSERLFITVWTDTMNISEGTTCVWIVESDDVGAVCA